MLLSLPRFGQTRSRIRAKPIVNMVYPVLGRFAGDYRFNHITQSVYDCVNKRIHTDMSHFDLYMFFL